MEAKLDQGVLSSAFDIKRGIDERGCYALAHRRYRTHYVVAIVVVVLS